MMGLQGLIFIINSMKFRPFCLKPFCRSSANVRLVSIGQHCSRAQWYPNTVNVELLSQLSKQTISLYKESCAGKNRASQFPGASALDTYCSC